MTKRSASAAAVSTRFPESGVNLTAPFGNMIRKDMEDLWEYASSLPPVQEMVALNWHRYLPHDIGTMFMGVAMASDCKLRGRALWVELEGFVEGMLRASPEMKRVPYLSFIEKRFKDYYGDYESTARGMVKVLIDLGLVKLRERKAGDALEFPESLPKPDEKLGLCIADVQEPVVFKARYRKNAGPRNRVMLGDIPGIRRMLNAGWARHLPPDIAYAFMSAAAVSAGGCTGDNMWENIEDLWKAQLESKTQIFPRNKAQEVIDRFRAEYGRDYVHTAKGAIDVLQELGLLIKSQVDEQDCLEIPEVLPTPDMRLVLTEEERIVLAERLKIRI